MDQLRSIFPDLDASTLEAALESHNNNVEQTVNYLLSSASAPDQALNFQMEQDEIMARRLQAEEDAFDRRETRATTNDASSSAQMPPMPSMSDLQNAVKPIIDTVQYAGEMAIRGANNLYREYIAPDTRPRPTSRMRDDDETVVLRREAGGGRSGSAPRARRPLSGGYAPGATSKKDA